MLHEELQEYGQGTPLPVESDLCVSHLEPVKEEVVVDLLALQPLEGHLKGLPVPGLRHILIIEGLGDIVRLELESLQQYRDSVLVDYEGEGSELPVTHHRRMHLADGVLWMIGLSLNGAADFMQIEEQQWTMGRE